MEPQSSPTSTGVNVRDTSTTHLEGEVARIRSSCISDNSRKIYRASSVKFIEWLYNGERYDLLSSSSKTALDDCDNCEAKRAVVIRRIIDDAPSNPPLRFADITATDFLTWIVSLRKKDGSRPSYSAFDSHRSTLFNLCREFHYSMSKNQEREMKTHFKGLKRENASKIAHGMGDIKIGKDPLSFSLYRHISHEFLKQSTTDFVFARCFLTLCWNLMSRAGNAVSVCHDHMEWQEDSLCIFFSQMKNDQGGERPRDPRHIYANPIIPEVCPILALGMYWLYYDFSSKDVKLFPGRNQYDRFRKLLKKATSVIPGIVNELSRRGVDSNDIGTHSMRKGSATYCSSGTTSCPSAIAICLRAGWSLGGVQDKYLRYKVLVTCLNDNDVHTEVSSSQLVKDLVEKACMLCFPQLPSSLKMVAEYALASVVYHEKFLRKELPDSHPLFQSILFRDRELLSALGQLIDCRIATTGDPLRPTGIPAHVSILVKVQRLINGKN